MEHPLCKHNQEGYCKFGEACTKYHENEICRNERCCTNACRKRHPRRCRYFRENGICKFGQGCAYVHSQTAKKTEIDTLNKEMNNMKAEIDVLKNTVRSLADIKKEGKVVMKVINDLKKNITDIKEENRMICEKIKQLEEGLDDDDSEEELEGHEMNKCPNTEMANEIAVENEDESELHLFQIEVVDGDMVWACNLCDMGLDSSIEMQEHMKSEHDRAVNIDSLNKDASMYDCTNEDVDNEKDIAERISDSEVEEDDGMFTCKLCQEKLDGNGASKEHYIKEHKKDIDHTKLETKCKYSFCMDIEQDRCSQFCNYYQNMLDL